MNQTGRQGPRQGPVLDSFIVPPGLGAAPGLPSLVSEVTLRSQITPDYTWTPSNQQASGGGISSWIMSAIKPAAYVRLPTGGVVRVEPYGAPKVNFFPVIVVGAIALGAIAAVSLVSIGRRLGK